MSNFIKMIKEQVKSLLFFVYHNKQYIAIVVFINTFSTSWVHIHKTWRYFINGIPVDQYKYPVWYSDFFTIEGHFLDVTGIFLLLLSAIYLFKPIRASKYALVYLWWFWIVHLYEYIFLPKHSILFYTVLSVVCLTFLYLCLKSLINRNK